MKKEIFRSYALVAKENDKVFEINWSKIKEYNELSKSRFKLKKIDFFTTNYTNEIEILKILVESNLLTAKQLNKIKLMIYPIKKEKNSIIYSSETIGEPIYKNLKPAFNDDAYAISLLNNLIKNEEFASLLYDFYVKYGKFSQNNIDEIYQKIYYTNESAKKENNVKYQNILFGLSKQLKDINENRSILGSICNYSRELNKYGNVSSELETCIRNYVEEFYLRQKYYVTSYKETYHDKRIFTFKINKNNERSINYPELHKLLLFIQNYLNSKKPEKTSHEKILKSKKNEILFIDGQLPLF